MEVSFSLGNLSICTELDLGDILGVTLEWIYFSVFSYLTYSVRHPHYAILAVRIAVSNLHKETKKVFSDVMEDLYNLMNPITKKHSLMILEKNIQKFISKWEVG